VPRAGGIGPGSCHEPGRMLRNEPGQISRRHKPRPRPVIGPDLQAEPGQMAFGYWTRQTYGFGWGIYPQRLYPHQANLWLRVGDQQWRTPSSGCQEPAAFPSNLSPSRGTHMHIRAKRREETLLTIAGHETTRSSSEMKWIAIVRCWKRMQTRPA
jgi:hypothetical protein